MTNDNNLYIGCHVGMSGPNYYEGTVKEALSFGANTFMFYTGAPQNMNRKPTSELHIKEGRNLIKQTKLDETKIVVHAPYVINLGNTINPNLFLFSVKALISELKRVEDFGLKILVLHPGAHVGAGSKAGLDKIVDGLNIALAEVNNNVSIALETMSGKGSELGISTEEIKYIINKCLFKNRLGVCIDTCHLSDDGLFKNGFDDYLDNFDKEIGIEKILCVHLNDSKNIPFSHKDRHENIGYGEIGFYFLNSIVHNKRLSGIPMILETPYYNEKPPYKEEIQMLKSGKYIDNWRENL